MEQMILVCDLCKFAHEGYDRHTGMEDWACDKEDVMTDVEIEEVTTENKCPYFEPKTEEDEPVLEDPLGEYHDRFYVVNDNHRPDLIGACDFCGEVTELKQYKHYADDVGLEFVSFCRDCGGWQ